MYNINDTLKDYVNRIIGVMNVCISDKKQLHFINFVKGKINSQPMADFNSNDLDDIFKNIAWVKDTKLAKEFQEIYSLMGFKKMSAKPEFAGQCYFPMEKLYDSLNFKFGFMYLDSYITHPPHTITNNELYFIISGTADWTYDNKSQTISAGNIIYNPPNIPQGVTAGHTPLLCIYFNWK